jgi:hypothetical protein
MPNPWSVVRYNKTVTQLSMFTERFMKHVKCNHKQNAVITNRCSQNDVRNMLNVITITVNNKQLLPSMNVSIQNCWTTITVYCWWLHFTFFLHHSVDNHYCVLLMITFYIFLASFCGQPFLTEMVVHRMMQGKCKM